MTQIVDDFILLEKIMAEFYNGNSRFPLDGPTATVLDDLYLDLTVKGLPQMIADQSMQLNNLSGISYSPQQQMNYNINKYTEDGRLSEKEKAVMLEASKIIFKKPDLPLLPYEISFNDLDQTSYLISELIGMNNKLPHVSNAAISENLNDGYSFVVGPERYNYSQLHFYLRYAFCAKQIDFDKIDTIVEIGSGSGRAVELIKRMHPHITFHLFDLGPQLYVANRYLNAVMPDDCAEFGISHETKKKIHFHCHHEIEDFKPSGKVLNWNTLVFCILEKSTAKTYFDILKSFSDWIYISEPMTTNLASKVYNMNSQILQKDYEEFLCSTHELISQQVDRKPLGNIKMWDGVNQMLWFKDGGIV